MATVALSGSIDASLFIAIDIMVNDADIAIAKSESLANPVGSNFAAANVSIANIPTRDIMIIIPCLAFGRSIFDSTINIPAIIATDLAILSNALAYMPNLIAFWFLVNSSTRFVT